MTDRRLLKTVKSPYLSNCSTSQNEIWHDDEYCLSELFYASAYTIRNLLTILPNKTTRIIFKNKTDFSFSLLYKPPLYYSKYQNFGCKFQAQKLAFTFMTGC